METGTDMYMLPCVEQIACRKLLCSTGSSAQFSGMTTEGGMELGEAGSRGNAYMHTYG